MHTLGNGLPNALEHLIDERVGVLHGAGEFPRAAGAPDFFHFWAQASDLSAYGLSTAHISGGAAADRSTALAKAIGEAIERYCAGNFEVNQLPLATYDSAPFRCVAPNEFALYSTAQYAIPNFPCAPFTTDTRVRWMPMDDEATKETWHVPAVYAFVPYYANEQDEASIAQPVSTGLACHVTREQAAVSAICEVIERDAFSITWQAMLPRPHINLATLDANNRDLIDRFTRAGHQVDLLNITMDSGVPVILAVSGSRGWNSSSGFVVATAAALDSRVAVRKSLEELAHTMSYSRAVKRHVSRLDPEASADIVGLQEEHMNFWCDPARMSAGDFLTASEETIDLDDVENLDRGDQGENLAVLVERVGSTGQRVLLCDVTTPDVAQVGLSVMRAVIPGYHPLRFGHVVRALGGRRLWAVPQQLGYAGITSETGDNPYPHPFP